MLSEHCLVKKREEWRNKSIQQTWLPVPPSTHRLDYCNLLFSGMSEANLERLQRVQTLLLEWLLALIGKVDIQDHHNGIEDQMNTSTIVLIRYDQRIQATVNALILIKAAS